MDGFQDFKNQFEKSPEEIMISVQEEKKIIDVVAKMDHNYQKIIHLRFLKKKHQRNCRRTQSFCCQYQSKNYESQKNLAELLNENE